MTHEEIIEHANKCGVYQQRVWVGTLNTVNSNYVFEMLQLKEFADAVISKERQRIRAAIDGEK